MTTRKSNLERIALRSLWGSFLARVPIKFKGAILQKESEWSRNLLRAMTTLWTFWFVGLILFSDTQKTGAIRTYYISIRMAVVGLSILINYLLGKIDFKRNTIAYITNVLGLLYLGAYVAFSYSTLELRTTWVTVLPAMFVLTTPRSGRNAILSYIAITAIGLSLFHQEINHIYIVSDFLFGFVLIGGGLIIKELWLNSLILLLEQEETQRLALQNEINILEAVESFIPKGVRTMIKKEVNSGISIANVIKEMSKPKEQLLSVLYSDYRNYSKQSANVEFVEKELILSSEKIIQYSEEQDAIVQNRGDSILAAFLLSDAAVINACRALLAGIRSSKSEWDRVHAIGKSTPDRYMIVTSGVAVFCSLGNESRQEMTIAGKPANLASRLDELTKNEHIKNQIVQSPCVIFDFETKNLIKASGLSVKYEEIDLTEKNLEVRTYSEEKRIFLLRHNQSTIDALTLFLISSTETREAA